MAKETNMQTIETEIKGIAKAVGASLKRSGHQVPHSVLLHALSAALDKRDWHKLKASLEAQEPAPAYMTIAYKSQGNPWPATAGESLLMRVYSCETLAMLRLAYAVGRPVYPLPAENAEARQAAAAAIGLIAGTVIFKDLVIPAMLHPQDGVITDSQDTVRKQLGLGHLSFARFTFHALRGSFSAEAEYAPDSGWKLSTLGMQELLAKLETVVPTERLYPVDSNIFVGNVEDLPPVGPGPVLADLLATQSSELRQVHRQSSMPVLAASTGPVVKARFWTDDHRFEVDFEAQDYFAQASVDSLLSIAEVGFSGDYCTDNVAEFMQGRNEGIDDGFAYIHAVQKSAMKDAPGFECSVDSEDYFRWMDLHHRSELAQWLCVQEGVTLTQADEPGVFGQWRWHLGDTACDQSFNSQEDACLDAYDKLGFLKNALDGHYKA